MANINDYRVHRSNPILYPSAKTFVSATQGDQHEENPRCLQRPPHALGRRRFSGALAVRLRRAGQAPEGEINAWDNPEFVAAVKATGRRQLIIAGTITSVCMAFPSIAAVHEGYQVFAVIDASGTYSKMAQEITLARIVQAGVVPMDTAAVCSEVQKTWNREDALQWAQAYSAVFPPYQLLIESYSKAQEVARNGEQLDSQRT